MVKNNVWRNNQCAFFIMNQITDKMDVRGVASLTDEELLTLVVEDEAKAHTLLGACGSLVALAHEEAARLRMIGGLGKQRARRLQAAVELGRRVAMGEGSDAKAVISSSDDVVRLMRPLLEHLKYEECWALYLTSSNRVIEQQRISQGGVQGTVVDHKLIVKRALELLATRLVLVHNHPSEAASPSEADRRLTRRLKEAAGLFDIQLLDHLIIAREGDYSFKREGLL